MGGHKLRGSPNVQEPYENCEESNSDLYVLTVTGKSRHPIMVDLEVNGEALAMDVDIVAAVSIISEETHRNVFLEACLRRGSVLIRTFNVHWRTNGSCRSNGCPGEAHLKIIHNPPDGGCWKRSGPSLF